MTGEQKQAASPYRCNEDDLGCLNDYFMAALQGEESKAALLHPAGMLDEERWGMSDFPMTEKLTVKDLNCENCTTICCGFHPHCVAYREPIFEERVEAVRWFVSVWGCARHPLALQVLAAPVIEELERHVAEYQETAERIECPHPSYVASGIEEAIKLLKERVDNGEVPP